MKSLAKWLVLHQLATPQNIFYFFGPRGLRGLTSTTKTCVERVHTCSCCLTSFVGYATKKHLTQNRPIQARGTYSLKKHVFFGAPKLFPKPSSSVAQQREIGDPEQSCNHLCANSSVLCQCRNSTSDVDFFDFAEFLKMEFS